MEKRNTALGWKLIEIFGVNFSGEPCSNSICVCKLCTQHRINSDVSSFSKRKHNTAAECIILFMRECKERGDIVQLNNWVIYNQLIRFENIFLFSFFFSINEHTIWCLCRICTSAVWLEETLKWAYFVFHHFPVRCGSQFLVDQIQAICVHCV